MAMGLVVIHPFGPHQHGHKITDPAQVEEFLASHPAHVVKIAIDDPEPEHAEPEHDTHAENEEHVDHVEAPVAPEPVHVEPVMHQPPVMPEALAHEDGGFAVHPAP